jgi:hypothetical protein
MVKDEKWSLDSLAPLTFANEAGEVAETVIPTFEGRFSAPVSESYLAVQATRFGRRSRAMGRR